MSPSFAALLAAGFPITRLAELFTSVSTVNVGFALWLRPTALSLAPVFSPIKLIDVVALRKHNSTIIQALTAKASRP